MVESPLVSIILLAHNKVRFTEQCLSSLLKTDYPTLEIFLVNNGSTDETGTLFDETATTIWKHPGWMAQRINFEENVGAVAGRNAALEKVRGAYIAFIDNDLVIPEPDWISRMVQRMERDPTIGVLGPKLIFPKPDYMLQCAGCTVSRTGRVFFNGRGDDGRREEYNEEREVQALISACWLLRREAVKRVGLLEMAYHPVQFEDIDYCYRLREAGFRAVYFPSITIFHYENVTTDGTSGINYKYVTIKNGIEFKKRWRKAFKRENGPRDEDLEWVDLPRLSWEELSLAALPPVGKNTLPLPIEPKQKTPLYTEQAELPSEEDINSSSLLTRDSVPLKPASSLKQNEIDSSASDEALPGAQDVAAEKAEIKIIPSLSQPGKSTRALSSPPVHEGEPGKPETLLSVNERPRNSLASRSSETKGQDPVTESRLNIAAPALFLFVLIVVGYLLIWHNPPHEPPAEVELTESISTISSPGTLTLSPGEAVTPTPQVSLTVTPRPSEDRKLTEPIPALASATPSPPPASGMPRWLPKEGIPLIKQPLLGPLPDANLVIYRSSRILLVRSGKEIARVYRDIAVAANPGAKSSAFDNRNPVGVYRICNRTVEGTPSLTLNYPSANDAQRALEQKRINQATADRIIAAGRTLLTPPSDTPLGGNITIQGSRTERESTQGGFAITEAQMKELLQIVTLQTPVWIIEK